MYRKETEQMDIYDIIAPFGGMLDKENRWVRMAEIVPWKEYEKKYAEQMCANNGADAISF